MSLKPSAGRNYIIQAARQYCEASPAVNDRTQHKYACEAAFNIWLTQISHMIEEWEMELMTQSASMAAFETIAAFQDILSRQGHRV